MRTTYITAGLLSFALALVMSLSAAAQTSATTPSPQAAPSQSAPQADPQAAPSQAPSQSAPSQNEPSQAPPAAPSGSASQSDQGQTQGQAQSQAHSEDDNPLNLTDEQKAKLRPIIADENQQIEAIRNDSTMTMDQKVAKANQVRDNASPKIKAILTPGQIQKLAELQQKKQQQSQSAPSDSQKPQN